MHIINNIEEYKSQCIFDNFQNSLKIEFLLILSFFALIGSLSLSLSTMKSQKNATISQYRRGEINIDPIRFNLEIYQKRAFY